MTIRRRWWGNTGAGRTAVGVHPLEAVGGMRRPLASSSVPPLSADRLKSKLGNLYLPLFLRRATRRLGPVTRGDFRIAVECDTRRLLKFVHNVIHHSREKINKSRITRDVVQMKRCYFRKIELSQDPFCKIRSHR